MAINRMTMWNIVAQGEQDGDPIETILSRLRHAGASKLESAQALCDGLRLPLIDSKRVVHQSHAWADVRGRDDAMFDGMS